MKSFGNEIDAFIKSFVKDLSENNVAVFAGAGLSKNAGFVNWPELLKDIADELGLNVNEEKDLISLAQYHVNEHGGGKDKINKKILEEFSHEAEETESHKILSRLPITTYWTTNYDSLLEDSLERALKIVDIKHEPKQLTAARPKRDVVIYKMHGDAQHSADAVITKEQYETYYRTHEPFITALSGDLVSKTFLFIGFSFTDPNLDYVLSRLNIHFGKNSKQHYCFIKRPQKEPGDDNEILKYKRRKQELMVNDLKRYKIKSLLIDRYEQIPEILGEIEIRFRKRTIFISGSAEEYGTWDRHGAQKLIHSISKSIVMEGFRIVNGFGWGVGSAVINGALEAVYEKPKKFSEDQLIMKPFPQYETGEKKLPDLWEEYRQKMISLAGVAIFIFGNKADGKGGVIEANGVKREFEIALANGLIPIPVASTGYVAKDLFNIISADFDKYYSEVKWLVPLVKELAAPGSSQEDILKHLSSILKKIKE